MANPFNFLGIGDKEEEKPKPDVSPVPSGQPDVHTDINRMHAGELGKGTGRPLKTSLPATGQTHTGSEIAPVAAGYRSAMERVLPDILSFFDKYQDYFARTKASFGKDPDAIRARLAKLDDASSQDAMSEIQSLSGFVYDLFKAARDEVAEKVRTKKWGEKFPKYSEKELTAALRKAKKSEKFQKDANVRKAVLSAENSLNDFYSGLKDSLRSDPSFKELDDDYTRASASVRALQAAGGKLRATASGSPKADKIVGQKKMPPMRPIYAKDPTTGKKLGDEPTGYVKLDPNAEPTTVAKPSPYSLTPKHAAQTSAPAPSGPSRNDIESAIQKLKSKPYLAPAQRDALSKLELALARMNSRGNFAVRKKEGIEEFLALVEGRDVPHWSEDL